MRKIDADRIIARCDEVEKSCKNNPKYQRDVEIMCLNFLRQVINYQPTVDERRGEWVHGISELGWEYDRCSLCGCEIVGIAKKYPYCPNCRAEMKGE